MLTQSSVERRSLLFIHIKQTVIQDYGSSGHGEWDAEKHLYTDTQQSLNIVLDHDQIVGMYFYAGYELNEQGYRVDKTPYYVPFA